jgi:competence protein CoiA
MIVANVDGKRAGAYPGAKGKCFCCGRDVRPKCGEILAWHWAHEGADCDPQKEGESAWHRKWKSKFPAEWTEVKVGDNRADVKTPVRVIEFQASDIPSGHIRIRENTYQKMVWVVRADDFAKNLSFRAKNGFVSFRWKHPRKSWWTATKPIVFDVGGNLFHVKKLYASVPCGGWGYPLKEHEFLRRVGMKVVDPEESEIPQHTFYNASSRKYFLFGQDVTPKKK